MRGFALKYAFLYSTLFYLPKLQLLIEYRLNTRYYENWKEKNKKLSTK